ncbi:MAG: solute:sodium symporter family transporter [Candidatus Marinimicrobia bacterium]|nr:solute:sodium symporter family transporter [Candidatus Neomarinimicrobiota bacterium]
MNLSTIDIVFFLVFFLFVIGISMYKSRYEKSGEDFFLASRSLIWPFIGLSLIAANISTEQFVGMSGQGAGNVGMAVASYEWMAAITLVVIAFFFLPKFLKAGIYTMPEYLEHRYSPGARSLMALYTMIIYVGVTISAVLYSGALTLHTIFNMDFLFAVWLIGGITALYTAWGGLKAVAWADLFLGSALILGGLLTLVLGLKAVGGIEAFTTVNADRLHMILPADHPVIPWTALVLGLWIPNFYYWGLNQYITQRTLAAKTLREGQLGVIFAAGLKLLIPFAIVIPAIISLQLYGSQMETSDAAYPLLIKNLIPEGIRGFIFASIAGAVISSLASMLNSASTIFTMDVYKKYINKTAGPKSEVKTGRITTIVLVVIGCIIAPQLGNPRFQGIFNYIQEFQGFISPGILAAFIFGLFVKKAPIKAGLTALISSPLLYGFLYFTFNDIAFLNRMAITFVVILIAMGIMTMINPMTTPKAMPEREGFDGKPDSKIVAMGVTVVVLTLILYAIFW